MTRFEPSLKMLLHNGGYVQPNCYYPDPTYLPQHATPPPQHFDIDAFLSHPSAYTGGSHSPPASPCQHAHQQMYYDHSHHHHHHHPQQSQPQHGASGAYPQHAPYGYGSSSPSSSSSSSSCTCGCAWKPVQETFLHKILTGKGYKNDAMCVNHHHGHPLAAGRSMDNLHYGGSASSHGGGVGADFAMAASCCYSGLPAMPMSAAAFPPTIPGL